MIQISKEEAKAIREQVKNANIKKTRHKFYMEESRGAMRVLSKLREFTALYGESGYERSGKRNGR